MKFLYPILILAASIILVKGADLTIKSLKRISKFFNWGSFLLSFIFVAISTSLPEIFVALTSAINRASQLSLGNVIGANIVNLTLGLGLCAVISKKIKFRKTLTTETFFSLLAAFYPVFLALDKEISRTDGLALLSLFIIYLIFIFVKERKISKMIYNEKRKGIYKIFISLAIGLFLLIAGAEVVVKLSQKFALALNLPLILIGLLLLSLGTTLPELAFGLKAVIKKQEELSIGNFLGTIVTNSCLALGLAAIIFPVEVTAFFSFLTSVFFFLIAILLFTFFIKTKDELSRVEGIFLILFFVLFLVFQFFINR